jgi:hypothetical protein
LICINAGCSEKLEGDFIMCLGGNSSPAVSEDEKIAEENQRKEEQRKTEENKAKQLEDTAKSKRIGGGASRKSLLTGSKGGLGYYDKTL